MTRSSRAGTSCQSMLLSSNPTYSFGVSMNVERRRCIDDRSRFTLLFFILRSPAIVDRVHRFERDRDRGVVMATGTLRIASNLYDEEFESLGTCFRDLNSWKS
ncbi:uncharacterized protein LOC143184476 [Calliopsis andreniformis]|uniref:uncharacterized protein LOC143184476 n=1 Tax=Calliopsis andreniformis TaxID=337506 RepID=UPI003FCDC4BD